jgi:signal transduction histidine kinase
MLAELLSTAPQSRLGDQEKRYVENVHEVVRDIQGLVGDVAELSQLLAGRTQVRAEEVSLRSLVDQVEAAVRPQVWERGIALTDSVDPAVPRQVSTDPDRLRRILVLMLGVVVSRAESEAFFRLDLEGGDLRALISSNGAPFPEGEARDAFEPFYEGLRAPRHSGGRSLALPLANELARSIGGTLRALNRGGRPTLELALPCV